jgi:hypothetical protein
MEVLSMEPEEKVRENVLRRKLDRMGFKLVKNRRRDTRAWDFGGYMILDAWTNSVVAGGSVGYDLSIEDVEAFTEQVKPNPPKVKKRR